MIYKTLFSIFLLSGILAYGQKIRELQKNSYVEHRTSIKGSEYHIYFTFQDTDNRIHKTEMVLPKEQTDEAISKFGVPRWLLKPYRVNAANVLKRNKILKKGLFMVKDSELMPDYNALIEYYASFTKPIADLLLKIAKEGKNDSDQKRIELAMRFVQDIPYQVPPDYRDNKITSGMFSPPEILVKGYGDCDSKTILFISIISHFIEADRILILEQSNHVLSAIRIKNKINGTYISFHSKKYLIAETAGPGHRLLGEEGDYYSNTFTIIPLHYQLSKEEYISQ
jgi:hypothetical protein